LRRDTICVGMNNNITIAARESSPSTTSPYGQRLFDHDDQASSTPGDGVMTVIALHRKLVGSSCRITLGNNDRIKAKCPVGLRIAMLSDPSYGDHRDAGSANIDFIGVIRETDAHRFFCIRFSGCSFNSVSHNGRQRAVKIFNHSSVKQYIQQHVDTIGNY